MAEPDYQALLDAPVPPVQPTHQQMLRAIGVALSDALGPYGEQPELASRWHHPSDEGRRLQVSGYIDLRTLERRVAQRVLDIIASATGVQFTIPGESFDDL